VEKTKDNGRETLSRRTEEICIQGIRKRKEVSSMVTEQDDYTNDVDEVQQKEKGEKVFVPVRCHKQADKEELSVENGKDRKFETPRRWCIY
jgi:hypothetical protein